MNVDGNSDVHNEKIYKLLRLCSVHSITRWLAWQQLTEPRFREI